MSKVALVTDSTSSIPKQFVDQYHLSVAPQILVWGDQVLEDGVDIQPSEFYTRLKGAKVLPTTSQASPQSFHHIFTSLLDAGHEVLAVVLSKKLSGTLDSALQAQELLPGACIEVVDSETTAMAMGFLLLEVARLAEQGASLAECKAFVERSRQNVGVIFAVDTLEFLHRGGRIGGGARFLATALNIKPILEVSGGQVEAVEKVRTRKKSLERLLDLVEERIAGRTPVRLATLHANASEDAAELLEMATARFGSIENIFSEVSPVVGNHTGPGTVGLAYMAGV